LTYIIKYHAKNIGYICKYFNYKEIKSASRIKQEKLNVMLKLRYPSI